VCGFCDKVLLYELEFRLHVSEHTDSPPFPCTFCGLLFTATAELREHLAAVHMPRSDERAMLTDPKGRSSAVHTGASSASVVDTAAAAAASAVTSAGRDESAVNREIATLLLNLHASRTDTTGSVVNAASTSVVPKAEDLSVRLEGETAMDLSKAKSATALAADLVALGSSGSLQASLNKHMTKVSPTSASLDLSKNGADLAAVASSYGLTGAASTASTVANPFAYYPSLATMAGLNPSLSTLNSNYLLQNLLLGKMQQMASTATTGHTTASTSSSGTSSLSFPTQPIPAQALSTTQSTKATASSMNMKTSSTGLATTSTTSSAAAAMAAAALSVGSGTQQAMLAAGGTAANIPLLCGQIVAQLNGLLFLVHSLNNAQVELSLQTQLSAIYARLQEVVMMVEQVKKEQDAKEQEEKKLQKQLEKMKENKQKEEEKIAKHIQEYQRAVLKQAEVVSTQIAPLKETASSNTVANMIKKAYAEVEDLNGHQDLESSTAARRRRGRPPKNSNLDLAYSPPEKRLRESIDGSSDGGGVNGVESTTLGLSNGMDIDAGSPAGGVGKTGGGKGIRNRVFCGECSGCLKNDDCGRCRYCQDKTKFGGQNRLRQKCLYRRCQMDTNRKRPGITDPTTAAAAAGLTAAQLAQVTPEALAAAVSAAAASCSFTDPPTSRHSPSPTAIYSGLDLARLAATAAAAEKLAVSSGTSVGNGHSLSTVGDDALENERIRKSSATCLITAFS